MDFRISEINNRPSDDGSSREEWRIYGYMDGDHVSFIYTDAGNNGEYEPEIISFAHTKLLADVDYRELMEDWIYENESRLMDLKSGDIISLNPVKEEKTMEFEITEINESKQNDPKDKHLLWHVFGVIDDKHNISFSYSHQKSGKGIMTTYSHPVTTWDDSKGVINSIQKIEDFLSDDINKIKKLKPKDKILFSGDKAIIKQHIKNTSINSRKALRNHLKRRGF